MRIKSLGLIVLLVAFVATVAFGQLEELKKEHDAKVTELAQVTKDMGTPGISKEKYDELNAKYQTLTQEIKELKGKLMADKAYADKMNAAKKAYNDGLSATRQSDFTGAVAFFDEAIKLNPDFAQAYVGKGLALYKARNYDGAIEAYTKATELNSNYDDAFSKLGSAYAAKKDRANAIKAYTTSFELKADEKTAFNLARVYNAQKDYTNAIKYFRLATQIKPDYEKAYNSLGAALVADKQHELGLQAFDQAIALDPKYDEAKYRQAAAYNEVKNHSAALEVAEECINTTKSKKWIAYCSFEAGVAAKALGNNNKALELFKVAATNRTFRKNAEYEIEAIEKGL